MPGDQQRARAVLDVVLADARADHALLDDDDRRGERAGAQQLGEFGALGRRQAGDLEVVGEHAADGRDADDLFLRAVDGDFAAVALDELALLLDEHDGHRPVQVLARRAQHLLAAAAVELHADRRLALGRREGGVDQLLAGRDHVALQQHRAAVALPVEPGAERRVAGARRLERAAIGVDQAEFEGRDLAEQPHDLGGVLHARHLHGDAVLALPLHDGLGDAERVDAILERRDVLLDREILPLLDRGFGQRRRAACRARRPAANVSCGS